MDRIAVHHHQRVPLKRDDFCYSGCMVVHFISSRSDFARGRFLEPAALLGRLEKLLTELTPHVFSAWEWRPGWT